MSWNQGLLGWVNDDPKHTNTEGYVASLTTYISCWKGLLFITDTHILNASGAPPELSVASVPFPFRKIRGRNAARAECLKSNRDAADSKLLSFPSMRLSMHHAFSSRGMDFVRHGLLACGGVEGRAAFPFVVVDRWKNQTECTERFRMKLMPSASCLLRGGDGWGSELGWKGTQFPNGVVPSQNAHQAQVETSEITLAWTASVYCRAGEK